MKIEWKSCFRIAVTALLLVVCIKILPNVGTALQAFFTAALPLLIGCIIAYVVNILMGQYEAWYFPNTKNVLLIRSRRSICLALSFLTLVAVVVLITALIVPQLAACVKLIFQEVPGTIQTVAATLEGWNLMNEDTVAYLNNIDWQSKIGKLLNVVTSGVGDVVDVVIGTASTVFGGVVTALLAVIFSIYLLSGKERIGAQCSKLLTRYGSPRANKTIRHILATMDDCFRKYIVGQCTEAVILGGLCTIGMWILKLPYATMIGALVSFTALIPVAGAYIGAGVGAFMILTVSPVKAVIFLVYLVVLQQLEGNLIYPKVVGSSIGLPGIWVLAAVTIGGGVMGIPGMLLGVPLAATVYRLLREDVNRNATG